MRIERGAIDFDLPENRIELDEKGQPLRMAQRERWESHRLVEECMLAANEAVARFFRERGLPTVNRFHDEPDEEKLDTFLGLLGAYGVEVRGALDSKELNRVLKKLEGHPEQRALHQLALRSMMQAVYSSQQSGHFGLGAEDYLHFTSPIRRYPDLLVHRLLKAFWDCLRLLRRRGADAVLGMGGYVCFPGGLMASLLNKPLMLVNADAALLLSNKSLLPLADEQAMKNVVAHISTFTR